MATRNGAPWVLVFSLTVLISSGLSAESLSLVGKSAAWETWEQEPAQSSVKPAVVQDLETPNQQRRRLGQPIVASFPAEDPGSNEETPNHRRQRLSLHPDTDIQATLAQAR